MQEPLDNQDMGVFYWDASYNTTTLLCLFLIVTLFAALRVFSGTLSHVNPSDELVQKDNGAFGISLAGVIFGITLILTGVIPSSWTMDMMESLFTLAAYGVLGMGLMVMTRIIFDRIALPSVHMRDQIIQGNYAVAVVDAGNVIAAALVIRSLLSWITIGLGDAPEMAINIMNLVVLYAVSQGLLTLIARVNIYLFQLFEKGKSEPDEIMNGNTALALRFSGRRIGIAFAIMAASQIMTYEIHGVMTLLLDWVMISLFVVVLLTILSWIATRIILFGMQVNDEVVNQRNIALGAVQGTIYIALGLVLASLMS